MVPQGGLGWPSEAVAGHVLALWVWHAVCSKFTGLPERCAFTWGRNCAPEHCHLHRRYYVGANVISMDEDMRNSLASELAQAVVSAKDVSSHIKATKVKLRTAVKAKFKDRLRALQMASNMVNGLKKSVCLCAPPLPPHPPPHQAHCGPASCLPACPPGSGWGNSSIQQHQKAEEQTLLHWLGQPD